jgi:hypothetical protein
VGQAKPLYIVCYWHRFDMIDMSSFGVASSSIVVLLLEGGRTSYLIFKIPITIGRDSMCSILVQSDFIKLF